MYIIIYYVPIYVCIINLNYLFNPSLILHFQFSNQKSVCYFVSIDNHNKEYISVCILQYSNFERVQRLVRIYVINGNSYLEPQVGSLDI